MKKVSWFFLVLAFWFLGGCNMKKNTGEALDNALIPNTVKLLYDIPLHNPEIPEWTAGLNEQAFIQDLFNQVLNDSIEVYEHNIYKLKDYQSWKKVAKTDVDSGLLEKEVAAMAFLEDWFFDEQNFSLLKNVIGYAPVCNFYRGAEHPERALKELVFWITPEEESMDTPEEEKIAGNMTYLLRFDELNTFNFNKEVFIDIIMDNVLSGKIIAYDFFTNGIMKKEEIKKRFGFGGELVAMEDEETGIIKFELSKEIADHSFRNAFYYDDVVGAVFVEDWFFGGENYSFKKRVKSISLVREYYKEDDVHSELIRDVVFKVMLDSKKP